MKSIYIIGSLRNPEIPKFANELRAQGYDVFDDWFAPGFDTDTYWQAYENGRNHTYPEALNGYAARHVFAFDKKHLTRCDAAILLMPAGRSGHIEIGWVAGQGKPTYVLFPEPPERYDVMYLFTKGVFTNKQDLFNELKEGLGATKFQSTKRKVYRAFKAIRNWWNQV